MSYPARQIDTTKPYKLRIYVKSGIHKGDLKRQEYFSNLKDTRSLVLINSLTMP